MNMILRAFLAAGLLLGATDARAENEDLDAYLETVRTSHALPALAAAVVKDGEVIASGAVGVRALGTDVPVTIDDRFHLGSDTKAMTATLAGMMVDEGRLRWDSTDRRGPRGQGSGNEPGARGRHAGAAFVAHQRHPDRHPGDRQTSTSTSTRSISTSATSASRRSKPGRRTSPKRRPALRSNIPTSAT